MPATFIGDLKLQAFGDASIAPVTSPASTVTGSSIDMQLSDGSVNAIVIVGAGTTASSATLAVKIQESTDNSTWTDLKILSTLTSTSATGTGITGLTHSGKILRAGRYLRAVATVGGSPATLPLSVLILGSKKIAGDGNGALVS
jgi:hypothetical protein